MSTRQESRHLFVPHTEERKLEIYERGQKLAREIERIEEERAGLNDLYDRLVELMSGINGTYADVECMIILDDPEPGQKTIIRMDTHETVEIVDMTDADRQGNLFDGDAPSAESTDDNEEADDDGVILETDPDLRIPINGEAQDA